MANKPVKRTDIGKPWNRKSKFNQPYQEGTIPSNKLFLIVCEGRNTEVEYLRCIPAPNADVIVEGGHGSKTALVRKALKLTKQHVGREVWCVYDMDYDGGQVGQKQDFNESIELARRNQMNVAYSNDAFELWFVLHYQDVEQALLRYDYYRILNRLWDIDDYEEKGKHKQFCQGIYDRLSSRQNQAIKRASRLFEMCKDKSFANQNPCTTVFQLINALQT